MEKAQINQWKRYELANEKVRIEQRKMFDEVRNDQWLGCELTNSQGPN